MASSTRATKRTISSASLVQPIGQLAGSRLHSPRVRVRPQMLANIIHGALYFLPIFAVTFLIGGISRLPSLPRESMKSTKDFWSPASYSSHAATHNSVVAGGDWHRIRVIIGKEVFGGTGMNVLNPHHCACFPFLAIPLKSPATSLGMGLATPLTRCLALYLAQAAQPGSTVITESAVGADL